MSRPFQGPITTVGDGADQRWTLHLDADELVVLANLFGELRGLLTSVGDSDDGDDGVSPVLARLFPNAYTDDPEKEAEYQRLMREELVASRLHQIDAVRSLLGIGDERAPSAGGDERDDRIESVVDRDLDEGQVIALMQSVNAVRLVLGTLLDVSDDPDADDDIDDHDEMAGEHHLYGYLSWLLEWIVRSLQGTTTS